MKTIATAELRSKSASLVRALQQGETVALTYRGRKIGRIQPVSERGEIREDDAIYCLHQHAAVAGSLTDREMDALIYGG